MRRDDVLTILAAERPKLAELGVKSLAIFGSVARDEAGPESDVDILVELSCPMGLFGFLGIQEYLEGVLGRLVDLVTPDSLKRQLKDRILLVWDTVQEDLPPLVPLLRSVLNDEP